MTARNREPVVTDGWHDFFDPETGQVIRAWVVALRWWKGDNQYGAYYGFNDEPPEEARAATLRALHEIAAGPLPGEVRAYKDPIVEGVPSQPMQVVEVSASAVKARPAGSDGPEVLTYSREDFERWYPKVPA